MGGAGRDGGEELEGEGDKCFGGDDASPAGRGLIN